MVLKNQHSSSELRCPYRSNTNKVVGSSQLIFDIQNTPAMSAEFQYESFISEKQLNNQSVSLVIPRITRDKIHNNIYYRCNLHPVSMRGDTMLNLAPIIIRDLGKLRNPYQKPLNATLLLGGSEFKCLLMKLIEIRPTWEQIMTLINEEMVEESFENKYIVALVLVYGRIQYYFLTFSDDYYDDAIKWRRLFKKYLNDYRKLKALDLNVDCWSTSQMQNVELIHLDEIVDWLATKDDIWGIPLGKCQWANVYNDDIEDSSSDSSSSSSDSSSGSESDSDSGPESV